MEESNTSIESCSHQDSIITSATNLRESYDILKNAGYSTDFILSKLNEFSAFFTGILRPNLLQCSLKSDRDQIIYLLLRVKKDIKYAIENINNSADNKVYLFNCTQCEGPITIEPGRDMWEKLTEHDHFEQMYYDFLNGKLPLPSPSSDSNGDSGIEQLENDEEAHRIQNCDSSESEKEGDNSFRFNFIQRYDEAVEHKIYPSSIMTAIRRVDKLKEYSMQRAGKTLAICLVCPCEMKARGVSKFNLLDHAMGQRHLRAAANFANIKALQTYHDVFLREAPEVQAHQVYFRPLGSELRCMLCNSFILPELMLKHVMNDPHRKRVMEMFNQKIAIYHLVNMQVKLYGVTDAQINEMEKENNERKPRKVSKENSQEHSESETDQAADKESSANQHNIVVSYDKGKSSDQLQLLPHRYKGHLNFIKQYQSDNVSIIKCDLCKVTLMESIGIIMNHIRQSVHQRLSGLPMKYTYYCDICDLKFKTEDLWLKHFQKVIYKHKNLSADRKTKFTEYECVTCKVIIYGDELSVKRHCTPGIKNERARFQKDVKLPNQIKQRFRSSQSVTQLATDLMNSAEQVLNNNMTEECCKRITIALNRKDGFEECKVYPFGSRISGLGDKNSDLDVFVDTYDMYSGYQNQDVVYQAQLIHKADKLFSKFKDEFKTLAKVTTARTPIIKIRHNPTDLECDLSFRHGLSVENTKFLRFCFTLQPITQPLILLIKNWASYIVFDHITTYSLAMLAIFYLQVQGYLVPVYKIRELNRRRCPKIGGWEALVYNVPADEIREYMQVYPNTIVKLVKEFFEYYSKFNYNDNVICPLLGETIKKTQFTEDNGKWLPKQMNLYLEQLKSEDAEYFRALSPLCIQDPFDLSHNLTKACQSGTVNKFKTLCELTLKHIVDSGNN